jgi:tetratricopeptide (TPR) repeat protein
MTQGSPKTGLQRMIRVPPSAAKARCLPAIDHGLLAGPVCPILPRMASSRIAALEQDARLDPENPRRYRALAAAHRAAGAEAEAMAAELAAAALEARAPLALYNLATACYQAGQRAEAKRWYALALRLDPALVAAHRNLAAILETEGRLEEARRHRDEAYRRQSVFVEPAAVEAQRVLLLAASGYGNVPIEALFPPANVTRITWFVDYAKPGEAERLPPFDLVFNAAGDPDMAGPLAPEVAGFLARLKKPLLNPPAAVARTQRHLLPELLGGIGDVVAPPVLRLSRDALGDAAQARRVGFPLILRPAGAHGGQGVSLIESSDALAAAALGEAEDFYLTAYRDYSSPDRYFRKYRVIFVDREPYPYHLAISQHWLVHYFSADMLQPSWKRAEEERFLAAPAQALGPKAMTALKAIGRRLDLDFCGIDFSIDPAGNVLVFEANATMLVHLGDSPERFPYKHVHVPKIFAAFAAMIARRLAGHTR